MSGFSLHVQVTRYMSGFSLHVLSTLCVSTWKPPAPLWYYSCLYSRICSSSADYNDDNGDDDDDDDIKLRMSAEE